MKTIKNNDDLGEIAFNPSHGFTLGVELEFQILDRESLDLVPKASQLFESRPESLQSTLSLEFIQSILEVQTGICASVDEVKQDLKNVCKQSATLASNYDCILFAASLHPSAVAREQLLTEGDRYKRIMKELQIVGRRFITQGIHVHVGLSDGETAIRVCDAIQPFLPLLLALSTSSPYYQGVDTGFSSYRTKLFESMPMAGIFGHIGSWDRFIEQLSFLGKRGVIHSIKDLWWDARPHPDFGTLEIRACDLPIRFNDFLGLTALVQALVATLSRGGFESGPHNLQLLRYNKWQAARHGLKGSFIDPTFMLADDKISIYEAVQRLIDKVTPMANELGGENYFDLIDTIKSHGTGADRMRQLYSSSHGFKQVIKQIHQEFWQ